MITWGLVSAATSLVGTRRLLCARFLLGAAEAGFFPGIILYLTYWFPAQHRARMVAFHARHTALRRHRLAALGLDLGSTARSGCTAGNGCSFSKDFPRCCSARGLALLPDRPSKPTF